MQNVPTVTVPRIGLPDAPRAGAPVRNYQQPGALAPNIVSVPQEAPLGRGGVSPIPAMLPELQVWQTGFRLIPVPAGLAIDAAQGAWYKFFSLDATTEYEVGLNSIQMQLGPTDSTGTNGGIAGHAGPFLAWGNKIGTGAAIVVGIGLPGVLNTWTAGPADQLGIHDSLAAPVAATVLTPGTQNRVLAAQSFSAGTLADTVPWVGNIGRAYGMSIGRIGAGRSLDVALCVNPAAVNGAAAPSYLSGLARIGLHCLALQTANPTLS